MKIPHKVEKRIAELLKDAGVNEDEKVILNHLNLTAAPPDFFLTEAALRRASYEADGIKADYYCYMCGEHHDTPESFIDCMQGHIHNFYAAIPVAMTPEHIEKVVDKTPKHMQGHVRGILNKNVKKRKNGND